MRGGGEHRVGCRLLSTQRPMGAGHHDGKQDGKLGLLGTRDPIIPLFVRPMRPRRILLRWLRNHARGKEGVHCMFHVPSILTEEAGGLLVAVAGAGTDHVTDDRPLNQRDQKQNYLHPNQDPLPPLPPASKRVHPTTQIYQNIHTQGRGAAQPELTRTLRW